MGGAFAHHDVESDRVVCGLVCSDDGPCLLLLHHGLEICRLRAYNGPMALLFADEALGRLSASLVSMSLRWSILVAILLLVMKRLVQILEIPLAGCMHISSEGFQEGIEVPSTSRAMVGLKTLGLLVVGPQHCLEAENFVSIRQNIPSRFGGSCSNTPRCDLDRES